MKIIIEFNINDNGDCNKCECKQEEDGGFLYSCKAFNEMLNFRATKPLIQCQQCKDYLVKEKSKVSCSGCIYYWEEYMCGGREPRCDKDNEQSGKDGYNWFCYGCKDKETGSLDD